MKRYANYAEKVAARRERRLKRMAYSSARLLVEFDIKNRCIAEAAWDNIFTYEAELLPTVRRLDAEGVAHIYIPHRAMREYIKECE